LPSDYVLLEKKLKKQDTNSCGRWCKRSRKCSRCDWRCLWNSESTWVLVFPLQISQQLYLQRAVFNPI